MEEAEKIKITAEKMADLALKVGIISADNEREALVNEYEWRLRRMHETERNKFTQQLFKSLDTDAKKRLENTGAWPVKRTDKRDYADNDVKWFLQDIQNMFKKVSDSRVLKQELETSLEDALCPCLSPSAANGYNLYDRVSMKISNAVYEDTHNFPFKNASDYTKLGAAIDPKKISPSIMADILTKAKTLNGTSSVAAKQQAWFSNCVFYGYMAKAANLNLPEQAKQAMFRKAGIPKNPSEMTRSDKQSILKSALNQLRTQLFEIAKSDNQQNRQEFIDILNACIKGDASTLVKKWKEEQCKKYASMLTFISAINLSRRDSSSMALRWIIDKRGSTSKELKEAAETIISMIGTDDQKKIDNNLTKLNKQFNKWGVPKIEASDIAPMQNKEGVLRL